MNSYQMVLHRPVETAGVIGNYVLPEPVAASSRIEPESPATPKLRALELVLVNAHVFTDSGLFQGFR
jgi:hypothetical protein